MKNKVYALIKKLPEEEKFNLISQMRRAALSMTNNLAEGYGRYHFQENIQYCRQCRGSIYELIDDFNDCFDKGYIDESEQKELKSDAYNLLKVLNSYISSQKRQKEKTKTT